MEQLVIHRDRQELQDTDLNNMQTFAQASVDHVVLDGIAHGLWFVGFTVTSVTATEVSVAPGRMYSDGAVFISEDDSPIDVFNLRPVSQLKKVLISVSKSQIDDDVQPRDFLIDIEQNVTEPSSVPMRRLRKATVNFRGGSEAAQPTIPATPVDEVAVAVLTLDSGGVTGIDMLTDNLLPQVVRNYQMLVDQMRWRDGIAYRIDSLNSDMSALAALMSNFMTRDDFAEIMAKIDEIGQVARDALSMAQTPDFRLSAHDWLLNASTSDLTYGGFDALVNEGIRFDYNTTMNTTLTLFNPNDPDVVVNDNWMLPKYTHHLRLSIPTYDDEHRIASYSSTSYQLVKKFRSRTRVRYGRTLTWCTNRVAHVMRRGSDFDYERNTFEMSGETWEVIDGPSLRELRDQYASGRFGTRTFRVRNTWVDEELEPYTERQKVTTNVNGQGCAQSFLNSQPLWLTQVGLFFSRVDAVGDVTVVVVECPDESRPSLAHVIEQVTVPQSDLLTGVGFEGGGLPALQETLVPLPPTFLMPGRRYAIGLLTTGDHYVALGPDSKQQTVGDFWFAQNGVLNLHPTARDKDMKLNLYTARFNNVSVEVDLNETTVVGGIESIDINADQFTPSGTRFQFEANIGGIWYPLSEELPGVNVADLTTGQAVVQLRAKFQGTPDLMPALGLGGSRTEVVMGNMKNAFLWASEIHDVGGGNLTQNIQVKARLEYFDDAHHVCDIKIKPGAAALETADAVEDVVQSDGTVIRTATFALAAGTQTYQVEISGTTDNAAIPFHVAELYVYSAV